MVLKGFNFNAKPAETLTQVFRVWVGDQCFKQYERAPKMEHFLTLLNN